MGSSLIQVTIEEIEALIVRMPAGAYVPKGPLAGSAGHVAGCLEKGSHGFRAFGQNMHVVACNRCVSRMFPSQENQARRTADGVTRIVIRETQPFLRHAVQSGSLDLFLPIASQVAVP